MAYVLMDLRWLSSPFYTIVIDSYTTYADKATELSEDLVNLFVTNVDQFYEDDWLQQLPDNVPGSTSDMARALAGENVRLRQRGSRFGSPINPTH